MGKKIGELKIPYFIDSYRVHYLKKIKIINFLN